MGWSKLGLVVLIKMAETRNETLVLDGSRQQTSACLP